MRSCAQMSISYSLLQSTSLLPSESHLYPRSPAMCTLVCQTAYLPANTARFNRATSPGESSSRSASLRLVSSQTTSPAFLAQFPDARASVLVSQAASEAPTLRPTTTEAASDAVRDQGRHSTIPDGSGPALIFPSLNVDAAMSTTTPAHPSHTRAKSTTVSSASPALRPHRRVRAASSATMTSNTSTSRPRLPSMLASVLTHQKMPAQPRPAPLDPELVGSFAPTSSPRPRLHSLLSGGPGGAGAGACTSCYSSTAATLVLSRASQSTPPSSSRFGTDPRPRVRHQSDVHRQHRASSALPFQFHTRPHSHSCSRTRTSPAAVQDVDDIDPPPSPDLPSICRTPSSYSYSESDYFPTAPSSAGPPTPVHTAATLPPSAGAAAAACRKSKKESLHPVLEGLERASLFRVRTACATCGKYGSNFPCCPKCGEMWCSRACRLQKGDGKRHVCARKSG
ncbi:hypothetical protein C8Q74DRAFT_1274758 [Fomes fomentarius]|nr:hypothetical protein C8Q74DRAFT_1274758 [Fomes fomentarius]